MCTELGKQSKEYCEEKGGIPINFEFLMSEQVTLREKGYKACILDRNDIDNQEKYAACLTAIGFDGFRSVLLRVCWSCLIRSSLRFCCVAV